MDLIKERQMVMKRTKKFNGSKFKNKWKNSSLNIKFKNKDKKFILQKSDLNLFVIPDKEVLKREKEAIENRKSSWALPRPTRTTNMTKS
ncbi:MAG: hypothetical protein MUW51_11385 [Lactococcus lactis]|nr:hypothetical protein [Lactococcus lactis]